MPSSQWNAGWLSGPAHTAAWQRIAWTNLHIIPKAWNKHSWPTWQPPTQTPSLSSTSTSSVKSSHSGRCSAFGIASIKAIIVTELWLFAYIPLTPIRLFSVLVPLLFLIQSPVPDT